ncbi:MAG TPA: hypothetical protein VEI06_16795 [Gemmatimonadaceae bacterium]|nr:hypothetical protein [Gemmatimonadaceae bacterium]
MPRHKDLKRLVRARMRKTGEAYTTARAHIMRKPRKRAVAPPAARVAEPLTPVPPREYAALAGMSDRAVKEKTGCTWERWVRALDHHGAATMSHREITALVSSKYKTEDWWSQMVTVGYERIKGLRAHGQRRDGSYEATKSRTFKVPVGVLFEAWANPSLRRRWANGASVRVRTATAPKSMRLDWNGGGIVAAGFFSKGKAKSVVAVSQAKLPDRETANRLKRYWSERLDALGGVLVEG